MNFILLTLLSPLIGALTLSRVRDLNTGSQFNVLFSLLSFLASVGLGWQLANQGAIQFWYFRIDDFNIYLIVLTAFIGMTTSIFSAPYMQFITQKGLTTINGMRLYHAMYQVFMFTMLLALSVDDLGILWVAMEAATLATVLLVSLYRTPQAIEAAWKYFILCGVGIALALFGTVLLYFAAQHSLSDASQGLSWIALYQAAPKLQASIVSLAFVFLLIGYGTKVGLVPLHHWLPDAHSEGPTPMSAILSGLLLNVALYAVVRVKMLVDGALSTTATPHLAGALLMGFGLVSFLVAGLFLHRQRDIKRMFSYSSIEHMGLMTFAFGVGGALATFAGLFHMLLHSLTKSAIFITVGHASHICGTQSIDHIRGLIRTQPSVGWGLLLGVVAIVGFPPFGLFSSEFLLLSATMKTQPWFTLALLVGLAIAFAGMFRHLHPMVYGNAPEGQVAVKANMIPVALHLSLVLVLGLYVPGYLARWLDRATFLISGMHLL